MRKAATILGVWLLALQAAAKPPRPRRAAKKPPPPEAAEVAPAGPKPLGETLTGLAKAEYEAGRILFTDGDFATAKLKFESAYEQSNDPRILWNIAACEKNLRHYARVLALLRRYLGEGGDLLTAKDREEGASLIQVIEPLTTALRITVNEAGADVHVDGERVGESPLAGPVVVDIGTRKVRVERAGFATYESAVPVGGAAEVPLEVKLVREVHEGRLAVQVPAGATIRIDGRPVGRGRWEARLPSGGHTLRVEAPGMRPYQSEVVISDNENRRVDVVLEALPTKEEPSPWIEFGVRSGAGVIMRNDTPATIPVWIDLGLRLGRRTYLGLAFQYGRIEADGTCGTDVHGASADSPTDIAHRYSFSRCEFVKLAIAVLIHVLPRARFDPWFGFDFGVQGNSYEARVYDPLDRSYRDDSADSFSGQVGGQAGLDIRFFRGFRPLSLGPFLAFARAFKAKDNFEAPAQPRKDPSPDESAEVEVEPYNQWLFGIRTALAF